MADPDREGGASTVRRHIETGAFALVLFLSSVVPVPGGLAAGRDGSGVVSSLAALGIGPTDPLHFVGYAVLAALLARTTGATRRGLVVSVGTAVAFGFGVELVQSTIPWRSFARRDVAVNALGAIAGVGGYALRQRWSGRN
ncbi:VanZ family protein [Halorubrum sp. Ea8]|uniref:VanZ family protein n=1 Tax=Halorubrum sp. Ea8 TaxID=1383841 RepID=UPI000B97DF09|nr:VanZ family protein [Halorubrum sp. Ea8]OYR48859.1 hypothetical protein DJ74_09685 [Halorubrum sp. Ea8]